ncbi:MAG: hypothetical protein ABFC96_02760 [Thermoguttaceae bacterium]
MRLIAMAFLSVCLLGAITGCGKASNSVEQPKVFAPPPTGGLSVGDAAPATPAANPATPAKQATPAAK